MGVIVTEESATQNLQRSQVVILFKIELIDTHEATAAYGTQQAKIIKGFGEREGKGRRKKEKKNIIIGNNRS